eukprot:1014574-Rhodomonas_salina.2
MREEEEEEKEAGEEEEAAAKAAEDAKERGEEEAEEAAAVKRHGGVGLGTNKVELTPRVILLCHLRSICGMQSQPRRPKASCPKLTCSYPLSTDPSQPHVILS